MFNNIPLVTKNILIINILVYIVTMVGVQMGNNIDAYLAGHYLNSPLFEPYQVITHMFSHSTFDVFHILFNMFLLVMFGGHLERIWGPKRYFIFYFACGIGAFLLYNSIGIYQIAQIQEVLTGQGYNIDKLGYELSQLSYQDLVARQYEMNLTIEQVDYWSLIHSQMVGASGAIFGLLAAFAILFPNTRLMLLFPPIPIKAKYLIGGYLAYEVYNSIYQTNDHIAHLAHVGGAIVGIIFVLFWRKYDKRNFY